MRLLDPARAGSLAAIPDGSAKSRGITTGEAAAAAMIVYRIGDNRLGPAAFYIPGSMDPGKWQVTPSCPTGGGVFLQWRNVGRSVSERRSVYPDPPPALNSRKYTKDYLGGEDGRRHRHTKRPQDRADVAMFYAAASPAFVFNSAARQVSLAQRRSLSHNARALALLNMAISDSLVTSFANQIPL